MKYLLLPITVSILMTLPVISTAKPDPCADRPPEERSQCEKEMAAKYKHDHRELKGLPQPSKEKGSPNEAAMDAVGQDGKKHDHGKTHKGQAGSDNKQPSSDKDTTESTGHDHQQIHK